jgi:hypothetical protein
MRGHTMGRRLGRVVAVAALGIGVALVAGPALGAAAHAGVTVGDELPVVSVTDKSGDLESVSDPVSLRDIVWG